MTSPREAQLAEVFDRARPRLVRVAYAVLGTTSDAEDVVSEAWLRLVKADRRDPILDVDAWATVAVARLSLDLLKSARVRRERYVGPWLPEPVVETLDDPADRVTLDESVSYALMVVLETLTPAERTTWVLHDLFGMPFTEVAQTVGRSPAAVRQLAARARRHVARGAPRLAVTPTEHDAVVTAFVAASAGGDLAGLLEVLDPEVVLTSDGGGRVSAARRPVVGAERVGRFVLGITDNVRPDERVAPVTVNGVTGLALYDGDRISLVVSFTVRDAKITRLDFVLAPDKLPH
jgi:RNA polymerase sigma-70 factor (ECF subfamily)